VRHGLLVTHKGSVSGELSGLLGRVSAHTEKLQFCRVWQENSVTDHPSIERRVDRLEGRDVGEITRDKNKENF
jgi:hypothetical protein